MARPMLLKRDTYTHALEDGTVAIDTPFLHAHIESTAGTVPNPGTWPRPRPNTKFRKRQQHYEPPLHTFAGVPRMDIAILITGSRGDVQPFIALGKLLAAPPYYHRVRIGTHPVFRQFVCEHGLDFYSIGGDPARLMSYMVRNPGILPSMATIRAGEIGQRKADLEEMLMGTWRACTEISDSSHHADNDPNPDRDRPFVADCIISNPPTFGSLHIAERLSIPMHMMFTMPWSPTTAFPHPLARLDSAKQDAARLNYLSYMQIELMTWLGLVDIINRFRRHTLLLDPIDPARGTMLVSRLKVPHTYTWSPALIPKPPDWGEHISICGFSFLSLAPNYEPDAKLKAFLNAGERPIYVGFGSIVVDDPEAMSRLIFEAVQKAGVRAVVSKGWSDIAGGKVSSDIFMLGDVPHDWLFQHVSAVVHHGGAGTCAIGLALGKPTVIIPFFGDQFWWADMVSRSGAGPAPLPYKTLTADSLSEGIKRALEPDVQAKAEMLSAQIKAEDGAKVAAEQFHAMQHTERFRCFLCPERVAVLRVRKTNIQLSLLATAVLFKARLLRPVDIKLVRHKRWYVEEGAPEPLTGMIAAAMDTMVAIGSDIQDCKRFVSASVHNEVGGWRNGSSTSDLDKQLSGTQAHDASRASPYLLLAKRLAADAGVAPINLFYNVANGFHNLPARKEVVFGLYDGITGLAVHPYKGFVRGRGRIGGPLVGCAKGVGRGVGGLFCRTGAMLFALPGYGLKGVEQELRRCGDKPDRLSELLNDVLDAAWDRLAGAGTPETRRWALQEEWLSFPAGRPLLQRRAVQSFLDLETMLETDPAQVDQILRRWRELVQVKTAA